MVNRRLPEEGYGACQAFDPKTGDKKWEFKMTDVTDSGILTTASDLLFSGGREGYFFALDARTGRAAVEDERRRRRLGRTDDVRDRRPAARRDLGRQLALRLRAAAMTTADLKVCTALPHQSQPPRYPGHTGSRSRA